MKLVKISFAEIVGTAVLVLFGCGVAIATNCDPVATSLAFGLSIVAMAYSIGNVSGCHVNPAVSLAMLIKRKISFKEFCVYIVSQLVGAAIGCLFLMAIFGKDCGFGANVVQGTITNVYADSKAMQYIAALIAEIILTFTFVLAICGVTSKEKYTGVAGVVIGLTLTLVHLLGLALTGTSVNPARSLLPAIFALFTGKAAITQVWIFIVGPLVGASLAALFHILLEAKTEHKVVAPKAEAKPVVEHAVVETKPVVSEKVEKPTKTKTTRKTTTTTTRTKKQTEKK